MGAMRARRSLEYLMGFYFLSHIPITLFLDMQKLLPREIYPEQVRNVLKWYTAEFKDCLMEDPPVWLKSFLLCELLFQLPFFPFATYAFFKGSCRWIRTPAIIYAVHTMTTLIPILTSILFDDFSKISQVKRCGPQTSRERLTLVGIYAPYLLIPLTLLLFMLRNPYYNHDDKRKKK